MDHARLLIPPKGKQKKTDLLPSGQFELPALKYNEKLPISVKKFQNLQELKRFCGTDARAYFENLPYNHTTKDEDF